MSAEHVNESSEVSARVDTVFGQIMTGIAMRTDRMFGFLMAGQWIFGIAIAVIFSPYTWSGRAYSPHIHVYTAIFLGGAISSLPIFLAWTRPGAPSTRYTIAIAQMLWSALLIHLSGGRIETHFHVFGSLAFLAFYRDWKVMIPATIVVAADHFLRGILWPESVYGIVNPVWWRFLEHSFWVVFEDVFLILSIRDSVRDSRATARRQVELEMVNASVESQVEERTSQLAASREQYRALLETTLAIPWELDLDSNRFTYVGPQATAIFGYPVSDWLSDDFLAIHIHPDDHAASSKLRTLGPARQEDVEFRLVAADGHWVATRNIISLGESARARRVLRGIMLDITERRKLELELAQAQKLESVGRLAAGIAHEINTPVQFVSDSIHFVRDGTRSLAELIAKYQTLHRASLAQGLSSHAIEIERTEEDVDLPYLLDRMPKALDRALSGLDHVAVIVRSMKEFAHPDHKEKTGVDLNQAITNTLTIANNECKYVAEVETDFGDLPAVTCYPGEINQVILNVVINAAHAIADKVRGTDHKGRIHLRTWQENGQAMIAISDTGGGIPAEVCDKVFDPFFTTKSVGRGTGQGLAIARSVIVDKHGGSIDFETAPGCGTTFYIRLPIDGMVTEAVVA